MRIAALATALALVAGMPALGPGAAGAQQDETIEGGPTPRTVIVEPGSPPTDDEPPSDPEARANAGAAPSAAAAVNTDFRINYSGATTAARRAVFEAAAGIWSSVLDVRVPIEIDVSVESLGPGILGGAAATTQYANHPSFPQGGTWYVVAQANQLRGVDLNGGTAEIDLVISSDFTFYEGLDAKVPANRISLLGLALHEIGHGLGLTSLVTETTTGFTARQSGLASAYDTLIEDAAGRAIIDLGNAGLSSAVTSSLYWRGPRATAIARERPALYAPSSFVAGSSVSHLDESRYRSSLLTPFLGFGEAHLSVPDISQAMLADMGWPLETGNLLPGCSLACSRALGLAVAAQSQGRRIWALSGSVSSYGLATDTPIAGDWDGNGTTTPGIIRSNGQQLTWHLRNSNRSGNADITFTYGSATDTPIAGDWDGNGTTTPGIIRNTPVGVFQWHVRNSNSSGPASVGRSFGAVPAAPLSGRP